MSINTRSETVEIFNPEFEIYNDLAILKCKITIDGESKILWYSVNSSFGRYLVYERADAFLVALLPQIAKRGGKVIVHGGISAHLLHNLQHLFSGILPLLHQDFSKLQITATPDFTNFHLHSFAHVGTGCSCGVDSMATVATYTAINTPKELKIDTLAFFDAGAHGDLHVDSSESEKNKFIGLKKGREKLVDSFSKYVNLPLLKLNSNLCDFDDGWGHENLHTFRNASCVLAMQKYFSVYHVASGVHIKNFQLTFEDPAMCEEFLLRCFSTESTQLLSALASSNRYERTQLLSLYEPSYHYLNVCTNSVNNCGKCTKCTRTIFQLDLLGKLDLFQTVFDLSFYKSRGKKRYQTIKRLMFDFHFHNEYMEQARKSNRRDWNPKRLAMLFFIAPTFYKSLKVLEKSRLYFKRTY